MGHDLALRVLNSAAADGRLVPLVCTCKRSAPLPGSMKNTLTVCSRFYRSNYAGDKVSVSTERVSTTSSPSKCACRVFRRGPGGAGEAVHPEAPAVLRPL